jgi:diguanylate cyclase (GGDEF)-like protein
MTASLLVWQRPHVVRRAVSVLHDVVAVSTAMYWGEEAASWVAAIYLLLILGPGIRFGSAFLWSAAAMSIGGFGAVYLASDYWQTQGRLSFNIFIMLVVVPPYLGALLTSLNRAKARLREQASFDPLTGLLNRRSFESEIDRSAATCSGAHAMLFCDLDRFKAVNDSAGHAAGDKMLTEIAAILRESVRGDDLVARPGGDEFCLFLPGCAPDTARRIANRLLERVEGHRMTWHGDDYGVGVSIGVALGDGAPDSGVLMRVADAAAYAAKNAGRGRVCVVDADADQVDTRSVRSLYEPDPVTGQVVYRGSTRA